MDHLFHVPQISGDPLLSPYNCPRTTGGTEVKNLPARAGDAGVAGLIPGSGRSLEEAMAPQPSIVAWRIPGTEEPGGLPSMGSRRLWGRTESDITEQLN